MSKNKIYIHETALVENPLNIGTGSKVWHWTHICKEAKIGKNCSFGQNVYVANNVDIGNNVKVQNNVSIYDEVSLGDNVFCGPSMVFTNVVNPRSVIERKEEYKKTIVSEGVSFGANCTIICGIEVGSYSFIAAGAVVNKNVKPYELMAGVPAKRIGWISEYGETMKFDSKGLFICDHTGDKYILENDLVSKIQQ
ncbi:MAG: N-acetyltransferase [Rickettsiales bacterium]|nr:N-acetyltransferase [Rickettsiales bacterium]